MAIAQDEESLFARWRLSRPDFVADGVVDETLYVTSAPRLLFLLKEVNDTSRIGRWDLRDYVRGPAKGRTWDNVARWTYIFRNQSADTPWQRVRDITVAEREALLRSIAVVNLKKSPGKYEAVEADIYKAAATDLELLRAQIHIYDPDVIVWCGTDGSSLLTKTVERGETRRGVSYYRSTDGKVAIQYSHPSARAADALLFYGLHDAVREILTVT